jgi:hypothetical protein
VTRLFAVETTLFKFVCGWDDAVHICTIWGFSRRWLWRMASSGMLRRVALVRTEVSEELSASFIRVTRMGEPGTMLAVTSNRRTLRRNTWYFFAACVGYISAHLILNITLL